MPCDGGRIDASMAEERVEMTRGDEKDVADVVT